MDFVSAIILSISMAVDAMCVGATDGIIESKMSKKKVLLITLGFGIFQFGMPVIGFFLGYFIKDYISTFIPWIAFVILSVLGTKSIAEAIADYSLSKKSENCSEKETISPKNIKFGEIFVQWIATSIDALTIGFIYSEKSVNEAMITFSIIGIVTFVLSFITTVFGKKIGSKLEKIAPFIAGLIFLGLALKFVLEKVF